MQRNLCPIGKRLSLTHHDICIRKDGECTPLYWHIHECDDCARIAYEESQNAKLRSELEQSARMGMRGRVKDL